MIYKKVLLIPLLIILNTMGEEVTLQKFVTSLQNRKSSREVVKLKPAILITESLFNKSIQTYNLHKDRYGNFSIHTHDSSGVLFFLRQINQTIHGIAYDPAFSQGYRISISDEGTLRYTVTDTSKLTFSCHYGHDKECTNHQTNRASSFIEEIRPQLPSNFESINLMELESYPRGKNILYLDFDGEASLPEWVASGYGSAPNGNVPDTIIYKIWKAVSEDYLPFDVNVTTNRELFDAHEQTQKGWIVFGQFGSPLWLGIAHLGSYGTGEAVLIDLPPSFDNEESFLHLYRTPSHEAGHSFTLNHDGGTSGEYYTGHGEFTPIMGGGPRRVTHWSKGDYPSANNHEDDIAIIGGILGLRTPEYASQRMLIIENDTIVSTECTGSIFTRTQIDTFTFVLEEDGDVILHVAPQYGVLSNLDVTLSLLGHDGTLIEKSNPVGNRGASISRTVSKGAYRLLIEGGGELDNASGFTDYSSLGTYEINGMVGFLKPIADFTTNKATYAVDDSIHFVNSSIGSSLEHRWSFSGETEQTSTAKEPIFVCTREGLQIASLTVTNKKGTHRGQKKVHVGNIPVQFSLPKAKLDSSVQGVIVLQNDTILSFTADDLQPLSDSLLGFTFYALEAQYSLHVTDAFKPETGGKPIWKSGVGYGGGAEVYYKGAIYKTEWWVNDKAPDEGSPWSKVEDYIIKDTNTRFEIVQSHDSKIILSVNPVKIGPNLQFSESFHPSKGDIKENNPPIALFDSARIDENDSLINFDVLANDFDLDGDNLHVKEASAFHGHSRISNNLISYYPNEEWFGVDSIFYSVSDGELLDSSFLIVTVVEKQKTAITTDTSLTTVTGNKSVTIGPNPVLLSDASVKIFVTPNYAATIVKIQIFDYMGNLLDEQVDHTPDTHHNVYRWDMRNTMGYKVAPGSYLVQIEVFYENGFSEEYTTKVGVKQ